MPAVLVLVHDSGASRFRCPRVLVPAGQRRASGFQCFAEIWMMKKGGYKVGMKQLSKR